MGSWNMQGEDLGSRLPCWTPDQFCKLLLFSVATLVGSDYKEDLDFIYLLSASAKPNRNQFLSKAGYNDLSRVHIKKVPLTDGGF